MERDGDRVAFTARLRAIQGAGQAGAPGGNPATGERVAVQVRLEAEEEIAAAESWRRGDVISLQGALKRPAEARNFGGFDYRVYLRTQRVHWQLAVSGAAGVSASPPAGPGPESVLRWSDGVRAAMSAQLDSLFPARHAGYMKGLVIGYQDELDPELFRQFSQLGLTHILAISGMHVAVFVGAVLFLLARCRLSRENALTAALLLVPLYVLLSGAGPSVVRAGIMSMIGLAAARIGVLKDGMNVLSAAALLMLAWNPYFLHSVSFQLSYLVTAGLMVYVPMANALLGRVPERLRGALAVTLVAQCVSFPLTIYYFNQFSLLSFAANLVLVPLISFIVLPLGMAALLVNPFWSAGAGGLARLARWLNDATFWLVEAINGWPGAVTIWRSPSVVWIMVYYVLFYGGLYAARLIFVRSTPRGIPGQEETVPLDESKRRAAFPGLYEPPRLRAARAAFPLLLAVCAVMLYAAYVPRQPPEGGLVSYLDVGQGDAALITTPGGANILVDGGGTVTFGAREAWRERRDPFEVGAKVLVPLLKKRGIQRLDAVVLTHADQDHAGGLQAVLQDIPVSALLFNGTLSERGIEASLMTTALDRGVKLYPVSRGMALRLPDGTGLYILGPEPDEAGERELKSLKEQNHSSVVFRLAMGGGSFLFTGDMDKEAEASFIAAAHAVNVPGPSSPVILKVAHHGSKTSTALSWLRFWRPAAAVVSAGVNNAYGHPNGEVTARLEGEGAAVLRTDRHGEVQIAADGEGRYRFRHKLEISHDNPEGQ